MLVGTELQSVRSSISQEESVLNNLEAGQLEWVDQVA